MKLSTFLLVAFTSCVLLLVFAPRNGEAGSKKILKQLAKLAAIGLLSKAGGKTIRIRNKFLLNCLGTFKVSKLFDLSLLILDSPLSFSAMPMRLSIQWDLSGNNVHNRQPFWWLASKINHVHFNSKQHSISDPDHQTRRLRLGRLGQTVLGAFFGSLLHPEEVRRTLGAILGLVVHQGNLRILGTVLVNCGVFNPQFLTRTTSGPEWSNQTFVRLELLTYLLDAEFQMYSNKLC